MTIVDLLGKLISAHAALHGYGDGREKLINSADLDRELIMDEDVESVTDEKMEQSEARKLMDKILFHGTGIAGAMILLETFLK